MSIMLKISIYIFFVCFALYYSSTKLSEIILDIKHGECDNARARLSTFISQQSLVWLALLLEGTLFVCLVDLLTLIKQRDSLTKLFMLFLFASCISFLYLHCCHTIKMSLINFHPKASLMHIQDSTFTQIAIM